MSRHPVKGEVRLRSMKPRNRYIEDWEIVEALSLVPKRRSGSVLMLQAYIRVKMLIGIRPPTYGGQYRRCPCLSC